MPHPPPAPRPTRGTASVQWLLVPLLTACGEDYVGEVKEARAKWEATAPSDYVFVYTRGCYCAPNSKDPVRVVVQEGEVLTAQFEGGVDAPSRAMPMEGLFDELRGYAKGDPASFTLELDPTWSYPERASGERSTSATDTSWSLAITCFAPSTTADEACPL